MTLIADLGFNCIRHSWANATKDAEIAMVDRMAVAARRVGLRLVLDNHTNEAGHGERDNWGAQQKNGLWYDLGGGSDGTDGGGNPGTVTDATFLADWQAVARHYVGQPHHHRLRPAQRTAWLAGHERVGRRLRPRYRIDVYPGRQCHPGDRIPPS